MILGYDGFARSRIRKLEERQEQAEFDRWCEQNPLEDGQPIEPDPDFYKRFDMRPWYQRRWVQFVGLAMVAGLIATAQEEGVGLQMLLALAGLGAAFWFMFRPKRTSTKQIPIPTKSRYPQ